jgi:hypothetical protein
MSPGAVVLATEGPQRHTRALSELSPRVYGLPIDLASSAEMAQLAEALVETAGGTLPLLWQHPTDDAEAVRYLIVNARELTPARTLAGQRGTVTLTLEEVLP